MKFPIRVSGRPRFDVLGFGTNAVDHLITVPEFPDFASKIELREYTLAAGGEVASTMSGLQRLGMKTAYAGSFGDDDAGKLGLASLESEGVDVSLSRRVAGSRTQIAFILIDERTGERTVIWDRDRKLSFDPNEAPIGAVAECSILHMTPHDTAACIALAKKAKESETLVSIDIDNTFDRIDELLPLVDILICSSEFPKKLTGSNDRRSALGAVKTRFGNALAGMTLGEKGSLLICGDVFIETPGFPVPGGCKDTTGAGDAFRTGLLYGILKGEELETSAKMANAVAALKCRAVGARTSLPDADQLNAFMKNS